MEYDKMEDKQLQETSNDEHCWQGIDEWLNDSKLLG